MNGEKIVIVHGAIPPRDLSRDVVVVTRSEVREWLSTGAIWKQLLRYRDAEILTHSLTFMSKPVLAGMMLRLLSRGTCTLRDESGRSHRLTILRQFKDVVRYLKETREKTYFLARVRREVDHLRMAGRMTDQVPHKLNMAASPIYLRTDFSFGLRSGGSVGHTAGVLNNLGDLCGPAVFITSTPIPTVRDEIETHIIEPADRFLDFSEIPLLYYNDVFYHRARAIADQRPFSFVYQRYSLNNYSGVKLSRSLKKPFVLEYNGSEIWISENWGTPLKYQALSEQIEILNVRSADLTVVVSEPMRDELVDRGIPEQRILVNPNGVDPVRYSPEVSGDAVRRALELDGKTVLGFIGTFGRWHGGEVLVEAFADLIARRSAYREELRLLMIGDGLNLPRIRDLVTKRRIQDLAVLTGQVYQEEGPPHLAACDILVAPHVPNPDGTPFFGSPTKIFEYMAMGKGIVASNLDQIGEVLDHGVTAWLVDPGSAKALAKGMRRLVDNEDLRNSLGRAAREAALAKHTWRQHTERILTALAERCQ